jgi:hypothetical protein
MLKQREYELNLYTKSLFCFKNLEHWVGGYESVAVACFARGVLKKKEIWIDCILSKGCLSRQNIFTSFGLIIFVVR